MAKDKISDYSSTANSNTDIAGINIDEGCAPSGINDAIRTLMAQLKNFQQGTGGDSFNGPFAGTTIAATDTTDASSTTAAAMKTAGGLAVAKKAYIGLDANIYGLTVGRGAGSVSTNTAVGASALAANTTGSSNTAIGYQVLISNTTASGITAVGNQALSGSNTGNYNNAFGTSVLAANTSGTENNGFGFWALLSNTTGIDNSAFGEETLRANTTGSYNTAYGAYALRFNTTASYNTAVGYQAGYSLTTGAYNTLVGYAAGYSLSGSGNTLNTFVGQSAGYNVTTGTKNTIIGTYNGNQGGLNITTASNYIVLSDGDGNPRMYINGSGTWFYATAPAGAGTNALKYNSSTGALTYDTSSARYKDNIRDSVYGLSHVMQMRSTQFEYKDDGRSDVGLIAEELQPIIPELVGVNKEGQADSVSYDRIVSVLVKAIQELKAEFDAYKEAHP
jgi:hypothetical protein